MNAYITSLGKFLPGAPINNDDMERRLGVIAGKASRVRQRILKQNGIKIRFYAIDENQNTVFSNAEMAAEAIRSALQRSSLEPSEIDYLVAATSQGDFPLPGFASMVHGELQSPPCEIATVHGVCASGVMALKSAMLQVTAGDKSKAIACASEFPSRLFKATRFEDQRAVQEQGLGFDAEFLRWMLSDGAGAAVISNQAASSGLSLRIEWIDMISFANRFEPCMYVGAPKQGDRYKSWLDYPNYRLAADDGAINLRQNTRMLKDVLRFAVQGLLQTARKRNLVPSEVDWLAAHYSSEVFRDHSFQIASKAGFDIPRDRWFSNLSTTGNVGSASIFLMLEELLYSGKLHPGQNILCLVPESGRFLFGYMLLKVVEGTGVVHLTNEQRMPLPSTSPPRLEPNSDPIAQRLVRELALVWFDLEEKLLQVPIVRKLGNGTFTLEDYRALLFNLRQQVIDGSRWIARAASSITPEFFPIRSAFIAHTSDEHRDFEMLERNYVLAGGDIDEIRAGTKNIGSEALSSYILHRAGQDNPFDLVGAMFIVEGIGQQVARSWGERIQALLGLDEKAVSFFLYHSESDVAHFKRLDLAIASGILTEKLVSDIVKCARVTARLYALQLEEIGNF